jgi:catechol 2,3-dioxygenase-like lactoylglutathione lyase family enzyme
VTGERTYPILPCPDIDEAVEFYQALGFSQTYRQVRPNPYAVVTLEEITIHLAGIDGFNPEASVSSVIITVPDADGLYAAFAAGLHLRYGRLPSVGAPRILRPRRKQGTATGFSVVDVGGNWLRFYRANEAEDETARLSNSGLAKVVEVAARQGDARGDERRALAVLDRGLARHLDAPPVERVRALLYRTELLVRMGEQDSAAAALAQASQLITAEDADVLAEDLAHAREVVQQAADTALTAAPAIARS